jgi:hypothetical protein
MTEGLEMNTTAWMREAQGFSLQTAVNTGSEWTNAEIRKMEVMKASGKSIKDIATALGRSYYSVSTKLFNSGLSSHRVTNKPVQALHPVVCGNCFTIPSKTGTCYC